MKNKIILVEDDQDLGFVLKRYLELSGLEITWLTSAEEYLESNHNLSIYSLAILDVNLPKMDGFELSKEMKDRHTGLPFLFLTAKGQSIDRILGLKLGAQDYIVKPCDPEELLLRIQLILNRSTLPSQEEVHIGTYVFSPTLLQLNHEQASIQLTEKEAALVHYLYQNNHKLLTRKEILENVWGEDDYFLGRSLDVFMTRLRKYFSKDTSIKLETVRGVGIRVEIP